MQDIFQISVTYKGKELHFNSELLQMGYIHKIQVDVQGVYIMFEPDEERNYRAYIDPAIEGADKVDTGLVQAIAAAIEEIVK